MCTCSKGACGSAVWGWPLWLLRELAVKGLAPLAPGYVGVGLVALLVI